MRTTKIVFFLGLLCTLIACKNGAKQDLAAIAKQELAKGIRNDSIFHGLYLGMTIAAFADTCREKHRQMLFDEGGNRMVEFELKNNELKFPAKISFYPSFKQGKISEIPVHIRYKDLEIWNPEMKTDKLVKDVKQLMEKWYGGTFFITPLPTGRNGFAQVSGNRRILIKVDKDDEVLVVFTDLTAEY